MLTNVVVIAHANRPAFLVSVWPFQTLNLEATFENMKSLERFRGHFYNWYATQDCRPLHPKYISTVDSGNLAGHLIVVAHACRELAKAPLDAAKRLGGVRDAFDLACEALDVLRPVLRTRSANANRLKASLDAMRDAFERNPTTAAELACIWGVDTATPEPITARTEQASPSLISAREPPSWLGLAGRASYSPITPESGCGSDS